MLLRAKVFAEDDICALQFTTIFLLFAYVKIKGRFLEKYKIVNIKMYKVTLIYVTYIIYFSIFVCDIFFKNKVPIPYS